PCRPRRGSGNEWRSAPGAGAETAGRLDSLCATGRDLDARRVGRSDGCPGRRPALGTRQRLRQPAARRYRVSATYLQAARRTALVAAEIVTARLHEQTKAAAENPRPPSCPPARTMPARFGGERLSAFSTIVLPLISRFVATTAGPSFDSSSSM